MANNTDPAYEASPLDKTRQLLRCQAVIVRECLDRTERAERELSEERTARHWAERERDEARAMVLARQDGPHGAQVASAVLTGLQGHARGCGSGV
jgi:type II secretory pathway component PulM